MSNTTTVKKDLFAPPTKEEMKMILSMPPSKEELAATASANGTAQIDPNYQEPIQSGMQTFAERAADLTLQGYYPQAKGAVKSILPNGKSYVEERDQAISDMKIGEETNPFEYGAGTVAGIAANVALPAAKFANMAKLPRAAAQIGTNLGQNAIQNPGDEPGVVNPLQLAEHYQQAEDSLNFSENPVQAALTVLPAAGPVLNKLQPAESRAFSALDPLGGKQINAETIDFQAAKANKHIGDWLGEKEIGDFVLKNRILRAGDKVKDIYFKALEYKRKVGEQIGDFYAKNQSIIDNQYAGWIQKNMKSPVFQNASPKALDLSDKDIRPYIESQMLGMPESEAAIDKVMSYLEQLKKQYGVNSLNLVQSHEVKKKIQNHIFNEKGLKNNIGAEAYGNLLNFINGRIFQSIDDLDQFLGSEKVDELRQLNKLFMQADEVEEITKKAAARSTGGNSAIPPYLDPLLVTGGAYYAGNAILGNPIQAGIAAVLLGGGRVAQKALNGRTETMATEIANSSAPRLIAAPNRIGIGVENTFRDETPTQKAKRINAERKAAKGVP